MRTTIPYLLLLCATLGCFGTRAAAQGFNVRHDMFGWHQARTSYAVEQSSEGNLLIFSNGPWVDSTTMLTYSSVCGVERFTENGAFLSEDTVFLSLQASYIGWSNCSTVLPDGRIAVSGGVTDGPDTNRTALYWFSEQGVLLDHAEILPNSRSWITYQHKNTPDDGFILTGVTSATGVQDIFLLKTDSLGNVEWWQTYGHPTRLDYATSVDLLPDGGYFVAGSYPQSSTQNIQWVLRTDSLGSVVWQEFPGVLQDVEYAFSSHVLSVGNAAVIASGLYSGGNDQQTWPQLVKLDTAGNELWDKTYGTAFFGTGLFAVAEVASSHDLIACGQRYYQGTNGIPYSKGLLLRTNSQGDSLWMREYFYYDSLMTDSEGTLRDVQPTTDGGFVAVGAAYGSISGNNPPGLSQDVWVLKVDSMGCVTPGCHIVTGIATQITNLQEALTVYPNPCLRQAGRVSVQVELPTSFAQDKLRLVVVNAQGQLVSEQAVTQGSNQIAIADLAAGLYYLHLANKDTWLGGTKLIVE